MAPESPVPLFQGERLRDLVLCYCGPWAFRPYIRNRDDEELLWHARQGVLLAFLEVVVTSTLLIAGLFPIVGLVAVRILLPLWLFWCLAMSATAILQATKGKRHRIPLAHAFVDFI